MRPIRFYLAAAAVLLCSSTSAQECIRFFGTSKGLGLRNNCGECKVAVITCGNGSITRFRLPAYKEEMNEVCKGTKQIIGEEPCDAQKKKYPPAKANTEDAVGASKLSTIQGSPSSNLQTVDSRHLGADVDFRSGPPQSVAASASERVCNLSKCMEKCESKFDPDECKKKGGAVINCNETFKKCQLYCTANCK